LRAGELGLLTSAVPDRDDFLFGGVLDAPHDEPEVRLDEP
jgi:hypothetical protein